MNAVRPCAAGFKAESHQWVNSDRCVWVLPVLRFRVSPEFCMGASRYFRSGGCDATGPPIEEVRPTQVCEAASDGEQSGGPLSACRTLPLSIQRKWDAPVLLRALDGPLTPVAVTDESRCDYSRDGMIIASADRFMFALHQIPEQRQMGNGESCGKIE